MSKSIAWDTAERAPGMSFEDWMDHLDKEISRSFGVDLNSPGISSYASIDSIIESGMINSSEPDILDAEISYRDERRVEL